MRVLGQLGSCCNSQARHSGGWTMAGQREGNDLRNTGEVHLQVLETDWEHGEKVPLGNRSGVGHSPRLGGTGVGGSTGIHLLFVWPVVRTPSIQPAQTQQHPVLGPALLTGEKRQAPQGVLGPEEMQPLDSAFSCPAPLSCHPFRPGQLSPNPCCASWHAREPGRFPSPLSGSLGLQWASCLGYWLQE